MAIAVCGDEDLEPVLSTYRALQPHIESRPVPPGTALACPKLEVNPDTNTGWSWPQIEQRRVGKSALTLLAFQRDEEEAGDFARNYKETFYVGVLRGADGGLVNLTTSGSSSEFAWFTSIEPAGRGFVVREEYVDDPCDGYHRHKQKHFARKQRFTVIDDKVEKITTDEKLLEALRCSDEEHQIYGAAEKR